MKKIFYSVLFISTFIFSSCVGDLDQFPHKETTSADVYAVRHGCRCDSFDLP